MIDDFIAHWSMDEASGSDVGDETGDHNATAHGTTIIDPGKISKARNFNGSSDYLDTGAFTPPSAGQSYFVWIKTSASGERGITCFNNGSPPGSTIDRSLRIVSNKLQFYITNAAGSIGYRATSADDVNTGSWIHVGGVFDGINIQTYINGVANGSPVAAGGGYTGYGSPRFIIGSSMNDGNTSTTYFSGDIDDPRIYDRALSADEVAELYAWPPNPSNRIGMFDPMLRPEAWFDSHMVN
jgi:hypothetical protein